MKIKSILSVIFISLSSYASSQSFDYVKAAQVYWKYRYRLVGDYIQSDSSAVAGEPGFMIVGEGDPGCGFSSPARIRNPLGTSNSCSGWPSSPTGYLGWHDGQGDDLGKYMAVLLRGGLFYYYPFSLPANDSLIYISTYLLNT
jgi:hypothetical protein